MGAESEKTSTKNTGQGTNIPGIIHTTSSFNGVPAITVTVLVETPIMLDKVGWDQDVLVLPAATYTPSQFGGLRSG